MAMKPLMIWKVPTISSMTAAKTIQPTQPVGSGTVAARVARRVTGVVLVPGDVELPVSDMAVPLVHFLGGGRADAPRALPRLVPASLLPPHPVGMTLLRSHLCRGMCGSQGTSSLTYDRPSSRSSWSGPDV